MLMDILEQSINERILDPSDILIEREKLDKVKSSLDILMQELKPKQKQIFELIVLGYGDTAISQNIGITRQSVAYYRKNIPLVFQRITSDKKLSTLQDKIRKAKNKTTEDKYQEEYNRYIEVKKAMEFLFKTLVVKEPYKEPAYKSSKPRFCFEQRKVVCIGTKYVHRADGRYWVPDTVCKIPEYLKESGLENTVCSLCNNCKRKESF